MVVKSKPYARALRQMAVAETENENSEEVTWEDQQQINTFSKLNNKIRIIKERLEELKQEKDAYDEVATEIELPDEDEMILYRIGEAFVHLPQARAVKRLEKDQASVDARVAQLAGQADDCETQMAKLKQRLYAKFGKAINLDE
ncbi:Prefoldin, subunit 4 [Agrocybe pediades]|nr:Prefoldin, subunit 4 [Agrocybe pediades]